VIQFSRSLRVLTAVSPVRYLTRPNESRCAFSTSLVKTNRAVVIQWYEFADQFVPPVRPQLTGSEIQCAVLDI
jgi:hypothetical protein